MNYVNYNSFEQKLIKNENISFIKMLIEKDIRSYKYDIKNESILDYIHRGANVHLSNEINKYNISDYDLNEIQNLILRTSNYNLDIEYLPTEDWEFNDSVNKNELIITLPSYEMLSNGLALFILLFPFGALFLSYFLIMIFR